MSEEESGKKKVAKRRRSLPRVPPAGGSSGKDDRRKSIQERSRTKAEDLKRLPATVLRKLQEEELSSNFMPGFVSSQL